MPFEHVISPRQGLAYVTVTGDVDLRSTLMELKDLVEDAAFAPHMKILADARDAVPVFTVTELRELASMLASLRAQLPAKIAFVIPAGRIQGFAELMSAFAEMAGVGIRSFTDMSQARHWLTERGDVRA